MITKDLIEKVSRLAHLRVEPAEAQELTSDLGSIFDYFAQLEKADVSQAAPMSHVLPQTNVMRADIAEPPLPMDDLVRNAPDAGSRFIRVPIIVEPGTEH